MDDLQLVLEEAEPLDRARRNPRKDPLGHSAVAPATQLLQAAHIHILHAVVHTALHKERAVELHDVRRDGTVQNIQLHDDRI